MHPVKFENLVIAKNGPSENHCLNWDFNRITSSGIFTYFYNASDKIKSES